jgi:hypothetical protein
MRFQSALQMRYLHVKIPITFFEVIEWFKVHHVRMDLQHLFANTSLIC